MKNEVEISGILEETDLSMKWVADLDSSLRPLRFEVLKDGYSRRHAHPHLCSFAAQNPPRSLV